MPRRLTPARVIRALWGRARDASDVLIAQLVLLRAEWRVRRRPTGGLIDVGDAPAGAAPRAGSGEAPPDWGEVVRVARAIDRAARRGVFRPRCLARALATRDLLERHGIPDATVRIGVRMHEGTFGAHAWVECRGARIDEDSRLADRFTELTSAHPIARPRA